jgi:predicted outer membrane repeat protein
MFLSLLSSFSTDSLSCKVVTNLVFQSYSSLHSHSFGYIFNNAATSPRRCYFLVRRLVEAFRQFWGGPMRPTCLLSSVLALLIPFAVFAETILVPDDHRTIQAAINAASDGDIVMISPGEYRENIDFLGKLITVGSTYLESGDESVIATTIINGRDSARVVRFHNSEDDNARLVGLTIAHGRYGWGGGIHIYGASPVLSNLIVRDNVATSNGGGIYATAASRPTIYKVTLFNNTATSNYGAIHCYNNSTAVIANSILWGNSPTELPNIMEVTYSDVEGGYNGEGNIDEDPEFIDPNENDLNLGENSPCVDTADPDADPDPDGSRLDMGALSYAHDPIITVSTRTVEYGIVRLRTPVDRELLVINAGVVPLSVGASRILRQNSPFTIQAGGEEAELASGDTLVIVIRFLPTQEGEYNDTLLVTSDDPDDGEIAVELIGFGQPPVADISLSTNRIDFGDEGIGEDATATLTIHNEGDAELVISSVTFTRNDRELYSTDFRGRWVIAGGNQAELLVSVNPDTLGIWEAEIEIASNDPEDSVSVVHIVSTGVLPNRRYQYIDNTGVNHSILILSVLLDGEPPSFASEIGVFSDDRLCTGGGFWTANRLGFAVWGDNEMTEAIDGMQDGETIAYKVWECESREEFDLTSEIVEGDENFTPNGLSVVRLTYQSANDGFKIFLGNGWSAISAPVIPEVLNQIQLWQPVAARGHLVIIKDASGRFYSPEFGFSNLPAWDFRQGYQIRGTALDSLDVGSNYVDVGTQIPLRVGWSFVSYFPEQQLSPQVAFANIADAMVIAKDASGRFYLPAIGFSNMAPLRRGFGYQVQMRNASNLVWNIPERLGAAQIERFVHLQHFTEPDPTGNSMSIVLKGSRELANREIGAFGLDGRLIGAAALGSDGIGGIAIWGDDPTTTGKDGAYEGEAIRFLVASSAGMQDVSVIWDGGAVFKTDDYSIASLTLPMTLPEHVSLELTGPNPFNSMTSLQIGLPEATHVRLAVFDLSGREVAVMREEYAAAGVHQVLWNADGFPAGIYLARLEAAGIEKTTKLILVK